MERLIEDISDTARWVAACRALETERPDAIFRDPYARPLAGRRGEEIVRRLPLGAQSAWAVVVRTAALDEMVTRCLSENGIGCVLNLAAGLDVRPYRLDLPGDLRWIEVDLPGVIAYKERLLAAERHRCALERVALDLADAASRAGLLDLVDAAGRDTLVLTEGLLVYLDAGHVAALSADLAARPLIGRWLLDVPAAAVLAHLSESDLQRQLAAGGSAMRFAPPEGPDFFRAQGWRPAEVRTARDEARRLGREPHPAGDAPRSEIAWYALLER